MSKKLIDALNKDRADEEGHADTWESTLGIKK
jgi:hypothetical protein